MKNKYLFSLCAMLLLFSLVNCSKNNNIGQLSEDVTITDMNTSGDPEGDIENIGADEDDLVENESFDDVVSIVFSGTSVTITNPLEGNGVDITLNENDVTATSTVSKVAYNISGATTNGSVKIYSEKKFKLLLSNASITNTDGPAINVQSSKTVFVVLEGTNSLTDASSYSNIPDEEDAKGAFFSEGQLVFSGTGVLNVTGKYKHGIVSDDYIRVREGTITVKEAVKDAIHTNDYFIADGGTFNICADSDGIDCEEGYVIINNGTFNLEVVDDGIVASYDITEETEPDASITPNVTINGGIFDIKTTEGEGIESKGIMTINKGDFNIEAYDDGINAIGKLYINGGELYIISSSNDAIDTNDALTITGGMIIAIGSREPEGGIDADVNTFKITGGTILGLGGATSKPTASACTQNSIIFSGTNANLIIHIQSSYAEEALTYEVPASVSTILYSSAKLKTGATYQMYNGGSVSGGSTFNGLYTSGTFSGGSAINNSFKISNTVTQIGGQAGGPMGPGGF